MNNDIPNIGDGPNFDFSSMLNALKAGGRTDSSIYRMLNENLHPRLNIENLSKTDQTQGFAQELGINERGDLQATLNPTSEKEVYGANDDFKPGAIIRIKNFKRMKEANGRLGVVKKIHTESENDTKYRIMFHGDGQELAISIQNIELLNDCMHKKHPFSTPVLIWPDVCKTDLESFQSLEMFPELIKAAKALWTLFFEKMADTDQVSAYATEYQKARKIRTSIKRNDKLCKNYFDKLEKTPEVNKTITSFTEMLIKDLGWKKPTKCFLFSPENRLTNGKRQLDRVVWYDAESTGKSNDWELVRQYGASNSWGVPKTINGSMVCFFNKNQQQILPNDLNSHNPQGFWSLEVFYKASLTMRRNTGAQAEFFKHLTDIGLKQGTEGWKDRLEQEMNKLPVNKRMEITAQIGKQLVDIDRQKMCQTDCEVCEDIKQTDVLERNDRTTMTGPAEVPECTTM